MKAINYKFKSYTILLVVFMIELASIGDAEIEKVKAKVNGLGCPFCVYGLEKQLKKVKGVEGVSTDLKSGEIFLQYNPKASFSAENIQKAVTEGGFTLGNIEVTAVGQVEVEKTGILFRVRRTDSSFLLFEKEMLAETLHQGDIPQALTEKTKTELENAAQNKKMIRITGQVHTHEGAPPGLSITQMNEIE